MSDTATPPADTETTDPGIVDAISPELQAQIDAATSALGHGPEPAESEETALAEGEAPTEPESAAAAEPEPAAEPDDAAAAQREQDDLARAMEKVARLDGERLKFRSDARALQERLDAIEAERKADRENFQRDPAGWMAKQGVSFRSVAERVMNGGKAAEEKPSDPHAEALAEMKREIQALRQEREQAQAQAFEQQHTQAIEAYLKGKDFPLVNGLGRAADVRTQIAQQLGANGFGAVDERELQELVEAQARVTERHLADEARSLLQVPAFRDLVQRELARISSESADEPTRQATRVNAERTGAPPASITNHDASAASSAQDLSDLSLQQLEERAVADALKAMRTG